MWSRVPDANIYITVQPFCDGPNSCFLADNGGWDTVDRIAKERVEDKANVVDIPSTDDGDESAIPCEGSWQAALNDAGDALHGACSRENTDGCTSRCAVADGQPERLVIYWSE